MSDWGKFGSSHTNGCPRHQVVLSHLELNGCRVCWVGYINHSMSKKWWMLRCEIGDDFRI